MIVKLRWFGHVEAMDNERLTTKVYMEERHGWTRLQIYLKECYVRSYKNRKVWISVFMRMKEMSG